MKAWQTATRSENSIVTSTRPRDAIAIASGHVSAEAGMELRMGDGRW
ncbi:hypothetical protein [Streptomyces aureus]|uniref:Uncharacterized protein n=1 Tax=Streptomyces aureus TaxID=193461 RepID=A0ABV4SYR9_9ACTN